MLTSVQLTLLYITTFIISTLGKAGLVCDETKFHAPYVKVKRKTGASDLDIIEETGFLDVSSRINVILCINGPAVMLSDYSHVINGSATVDIYSSPSFEVHVHNCFKINKVAEKDLDKLDKATHPIVMTKGLKVENRVVGVNLIGKENDYRLPEKKWFLQEGYGHSIHSEAQVHDGSFAVIGQETHCLHVNSEFYVILESQAATAEEICFWTVDHKAAFFERYEAIFRSKKTTDQYVWEDCPPPPPGPITTTTPSSGLTTPSTPDPFSIIDPTRFHFGEGGGGGTLGPGDKPQISVQYRVELDDCHEFPVFSSSGCVDKKYPEDCDLDKHTSTYCKECDLLKQVLPAENIKVLTGDLEWRKEVMEIIADIFGQVCEAFPPYMPYSIMRVLEFYLYLAFKNTQTDSITRAKSQVWNTILSDLRLCQKKAKSPIEFLWVYTDLPTEDEDLAPIKKVRKRSIANIPDEMDLSDNDISKREDFLSENFIDPKQNHNPFVGFSEEMLKEGSSFSFLEEEPEDQMRQKKQVTDNSEYYEEIKRNPAYNFLAYPRDVIVLRSVNESYPEEPEFIFYYEDTSESQFELNIAIDMAWKITSTVAGYCNQHYHPRESETFPRFYNRFYEDFLRPVEEDWTYPGEDNEILQILLNDWNSEPAARWLDTCHEGSYVHSQTPTFRPPRPLNVNGAKAQLIANSFVDLPDYQKEKFHNLYKMSNSHITLNF